MQIQLRRISTNVSYVLVGNEVTLLFSYQDLVAARFKDEYLYDSHTKHTPTTWKHIHVFTQEGKSTGITLGGLQRRIAYEIKSQE